MLTSLYDFISARLEEVSNKLLSHYEEPSYELMSKFIDYFQKGQYSKIDSEYIEFLKSKGKFDFSI